MHTARLVGLSIMLASTLAPAAAHAQGGPTAGGSCGYKAGEYGLHNLSPLDIRNPHYGAMNVGTIHAQVEYSGVQPGTVLKIVPTTGSPNGGPDLGATGTVRTVTAQGPSGAFAFSSTQNENGATRYQSRGKGVGGEVRKSKKGSSKNGGTSSAGQSNGAGLYYFQTWANGNLIGTFTCGVEDRE
jgi:hypothetical protein